MKILILAMNIKGGMVHYVSQLANALSEENDVVVIAPIGVNRDTFSENVRLTELPLGNIARNFIVNTLIVTRPLNLIRTIRRENPDVIHIQEPHLWWSFFLPYLSKYPLVFTVHDVNPHPGDRRFDQIIGQKHVVDHSNDLIVHGESAKKELLTKYSIPESRCHVIPHGDYSFFSQYKTDATTEKETILFFGRIEDYKGLEYLINAIYIVSDVYPEIKLIIAGQGDLTRYEDKIRENTDLFEIYNEYISDSRVAEFFQRASLVVLPYIEGTQTGIIPIAYAFKKPVIVTDVGSIPEVVEHGKTGLVVRSRDAFALADAIQELLHDEAMRQRMGIEAHKKMQNELSWDVIARKTVDVYACAMSRDNV
ncbi:glycosyltransferase family 4 protein [Methanoculleus horonobensis]|uniref:glycosyltransferase family 4 protein n=1 Tax=Methanoculleus horonobensis TaxID=528314 RepID=UPI000831DBA6|nr:glycosyltransferase family 4 protein [Methanoculleus horonobensis]